MVYNCATMKKKLFKSLFILWGVMPILLSSSCVIGRKNQNPNNEKENENNKPKDENKEKENPKDQGQEPKKPETEDINVHLSNISIRLKTNKKASEVTKDDLIFDKLDTTKYEVTDLQLKVNGDILTVTFKIKDKTSLKVSSEKSITLNNLEHKQTEEEILNELAKKVTADVENKSNKLASSITESDLKFTNIPTEHEIINIKLTKYSFSIEVTFSLKNKKNNKISQETKIVINGFKWENNPNPNGKFDGSQYYEKSKHPDLFRSEHLFTHEELAKNSILELQMQTPLYKVKFNNFKWILRNYQTNGMDFLNRPADFQMSSKFFEELQDVGIFGDEGTTDEEKLRFFNPQLSSEFITQQKYLEKFENSESSSYINGNEIFEKINKIILENKFGFLPSNLSQLFYWMKLDEIAKIFNITDLNNIQANFNDKEGKIDFLLTDSSNQKYIFKFDKNNLSNLKKDDDFYDYIYQRSFNVQAYLWKWVHEGFDPDWHIHQEFPGATAWLVDRIVDEEKEKKDTYTFLAATNIHVLNWVENYDKSKYFSNDELFLEYDASKIKNILSAGWNGGLATHSLGNDPKNYADNDTIFHHWLPGGKRSYNRLVRKDEKNYAAYLHYKKSNDGNSVDATGKPTERLGYTNIAKTYNDIFWYTPRFKSSGIQFEQVDYEKMYFNNFDASTRIGSTNNGGMDLVLFKIEINKNMIQKLFPELHKILGTPKEKDWYVGVGNDEKFSAYQTQFLAGFPYDYDDDEFKFKGQKSVGGTILTKNRKLSVDPYVQALWVKYNEQENKDWNSLNDKWKDYVKPFRDDHLHGMKKEILVQSSILRTYVPDHYDLLTGGASGSMAIDSKFNLIGITFLESKSSEQEGGKAKYVSNGIGLFNSHTQYDNFSGNIREDILNKLKKENLKTVKLNNN